MKSVIQKLEGAFFILSYIKDILVFTCEIC